MNWTGGARARFGLKNTGIHEELQKRNIAKQALLGNQESSTRVRTVPLLQFLKDNFEMGHDLALQLTHQLEINKIHASNASPLEFERYGIVDGLTEDGSPPKPPCSDCTPDSIQNNNSSFPTHTKVPSTSAEPSVMSKRNVCSFPDTSITRSGRNPGGSPFQFSDCSSTSYSPLPLSGPIERSIFK